MMALLLACVTANGLWQVVAGPASGRGIRNSGQVPVRGPAGLRRRDEDLGLARRALMSLLVG